jgi:hypothetical protein
MKDGPFPVHYEAFEGPVVSVLAPAIRGNPAARVFKDDLEAFSDAKRNSCFGRKPCSSRCSLSRGSQCRALTGYHPSIDIRRWAAIIPATAAVLTIIVWIIHVYAAIWIRGSFDGIARGAVTGGWGWRHYRLWLRNQVKDPSQIIKEPSRANQEQKLEPAE